MKKYVLLCSMFFVSTSLYSMIVHGPCAARARRARGMHDFRYRYVDMKRVLGTEQMLSVLPEKEILPQTCLFLMRSDIDGMEDLILLKNLSHNADISDRYRNIFSLLEKHISYYRETEELHYTCYTPSLEVVPLIHIAVREDSDELLGITLRYHDICDSFVDVPDENSNTVLYKAAAQASFPLVKRLINFSAHENSRNEKKKTPLHAVVTSPLINQSASVNQRFIATLACLKEAGADSSLQDDNNKTPINYIDTEIEKLSNSGSQTMFNEKGELLHVYYKMRAVLCGAQSAAE